MKRQISKTQLILLPTLVGVLAGITSMFFQPVYNLFRSQLSHDIDNLTDQQDIWFEDKVFELPNGLMARSYSSYNKSLLKDTLGLFTEVKVYLPSFQKDTTAYRGLRMLSHNTSTEILSFKKQGEIRDWQPFIAWSMFGFFIGLLLYYFRFLFKGKSKNDEKVNS